MPRRACFRLVRPKDGARARGARRIDYELSLSTSFEQKTTDACNDKAKADEWSYRIFSQPFIRAGFIDASKGRPVKCIGSVRPGLVTNSSLR